METENPGFPGLSFESSSVSLHMSSWQVLSSSVQILMGSICEPPYSGMGFSWATQGQSEMPVLSWLYASVWGYVHSGVGFKDHSVFGCIRLILTSLRIPAAEMDPKREWDHNVCWSKQHKALWDFRTWKLQ